MCLKRILFAAAVALLALPLAANAYPRVYVGVGVGYPYAYPYPYYYGYYPRYYAPGVVVVPPPVVVAPGAPAYVQPAPAPAPAAAPSARTVNQTTAPPLLEPGIYPQQIAPPPPNP